MTVLVNEVAPVEVPVETPETVRPMVAPQVAPPAAAVPPPTAAALAPVEPPPAVQVSATAPEPVAVETLPPDPVTPMVTAPRVQPVNPFTIPAPDLSPWRAFVAEVRAGMESLAALAAGFTRAVQNIAVPVEPMVRPAFAAAADLGRQVVTPQFVPPAPPRDVTGNAALLTAARVIIEVEPSALFDVRQRQVTLDLMQQDATRKAMGGTGVTSRGR
jgi:hypothetical protein